MAVFFDNLRPAVLAVKHFQDSVERDVSKFNAKKLDKILERVRKEGEAELRRMYTVMSKQHFPKAKSASDVPRILALEMQRHINRWNQNIKTAGATAKDSVPEFRNPVRAKMKDGTRKSILARLDKSLGRGDNEPGLGKLGGRSLYGKARLNTKRNRKVLIRLYQYIKGLVGTAPRNFQREFKLDILRVTRKSGTKILVKLTGGVGPRSCSTCKGLNGRILTEDAHRYATEFLNPPLYHPNCRHSVQTGKMQGLTVATYDAKVHGELITLPVLHKMVSSGVLSKGKRRRAFVRT